MFWFFLSMLVKFSYKVAWNHIWNSEWWMRHHFLVIFSYQDYDETWQAEARVFCNDKPIKTRMSDMIIQLLIFKNRLWWLNNMLFFKDNNSELRLHCEISHNINKIIIVKDMKWWQWRPRWMMIYYYQLMIMITVLNLTYVTEVTCLIIQLLLFLIIIE